MNYTLFLFLVLTIFSVQGAPLMLPVLATSFIKSRVQHMFLGMGQARKFIHEKISLAQRGQLKLADLISIKTGMMQLASPMEPMVLTDYIANKAKSNFHAVNAPGHSLYLNKAGETNVAKQLAGFYIILNEAEVVIVEDLLSSSNSCPLDTKWYRKSPCQSMAADIIQKIYERFKDLNEINKKKGNTSVELPVEWIQSLELIVARLQAFEAVIDKSSRKMLGKMSQFVANSLK